MWTALESSTLPKSKRNPLFEAAVRGLHRLDSSFWTEDDVFDRMCVTVEVHEEPTTHTVMVEKLKRWLKSHGNHTAGIRASKRKKTNCGSSYLGRIDESDQTRSAGGNWLRRSCRLPLPPIMFSPKTEFAQFDEHYVAVAQ